MKSLILDEACRTIAVVEKGRRVKVSMATVVLRVVALNVGKGNNRAAKLFTTLVSKTEAKKGNWQRKPSRARFSRLVSETALKEIRGAGGDCLGMLDGKARRNPW